MINRLAILFSSIVLTACGKPATPVAPAPTAAEVLATYSSSDTTVLAAVVAVPADVAAPPADVHRTPKGVSYKVLVPGTGSRNPAKDSEVTVHYTGWTTDGKQFDSSIERGEPATFPLQKLIKGWGDVVPLMTEGATFRVWIPEAMAYQGKPDKPAGMLVFDIQLLQIVK